VVLSIDGKEAKADTEANLFNANAWNLLVHSRYLLRIGVPRGSAARMKIPMGCCGSFLEGEQFFVSHSLSGGQLNRFYSTIVRASAAGSLPRLKSSVVFRFWHFNFEFNGLPSDTIQIMLRLRVNIPL